jgi:hypothetical protein
LSRSSRNWRRAGIQSNHGWGLQSSSKFQHLVHRPLIESVLAVLARQDPAVRRYQEIRRQTEAPAVRRKLRALSLAPEDEHDAPRNRSQDRRPGSWIEKGLSSRLDGEPLLVATARHAQRIDPEREFRAGIVALLRGLELEQRL